MKIVQINETCGIGGPGRTTAELAEYLTGAGHEATVFYASGRPSFPGSIRIGNDLDHKLHALLSRLTGKQAYFSRLATRKMLRQITAIQPDVVHLRNLHGNYIHLGLLLQYLAAHDIPTVLTLHDCWFMTGKCTYYVSANCRKWETQCGKCPLLHRDNVNPTWLFDRTTKCFRDKKRWLTAIPRLAVVGVSQWVADEAKRSFLQNQDPIAIYNWIDTRVFFPRDTTEIRQKYSLGDAFTVLMVTSQVCDNKGYQVLLGLAERLRLEDKLVLVGKNDLKLPIPERVVYIPHTGDAQELAAIYAAADVCVNTTKFETFGKVTAEALCCGTPAVVYNNTASPELIGPDCGAVVEEAEGIEAVLSAVEEMQRKGKASYGKACASFAAERFDPEVGCGQYVALYKDLLSPKRGGRAP